MQVIGWGVVGAGDVCERKGGPPLYRVHFLLGDFACVSSTVEDPPPENNAVRGHVPRAAGFNLLG